MSAEKTSGFSIRGISLFVLLYVATKLIVEHKIPKKKCSILIVAMPREAEALGIPCKVIGIGAVFLPEMAEDDIIVNVGYCGPVEIKPGTIVEPDETVSYETGEGRKLATQFDVLHVPCFYIGAVCDGTLLGLPFHT